MDRTFQSRREERFYHTLRDRVTRWAQERDIPDPQLQYLLVAPDLFVLLSRLAMDGRVPASAKARVAAGIVYFVSPIDLVPDFLGPAGLLDDVVVGAWVIHTLCAELNALDPTILREHWEGEGDVLQRVTDIIGRAEDVLGKGLQFVVSALRRPGYGGRGRGRG